jgi:hypothetical protein
MMLSGPAEPLPLPSSSSQTSGPFTTKKQRIGSSDSYATSVCPSPGVS